ncbi:MAG: pentapeptide repeat-containing protein [Puniceicoccaceae bacterium]
MAKCSILVRWVLIGIALFGAINLQAARYKNLRGLWVELLDRNGNPHPYDGIDIQAGVNLVGINLSNADLTGANLTNVDLGNADLSGVLIRAAVVNGTNFRGANLYRITSSQLIGTPLALPVDWTLVFPRDLGEGADLFDGHLIGPGADLRDADLSNTTLEEVNFTNAQLERIKLSKSSLRKAILNGANLEYADLVEADLWNATLTGANLSFANLTKANFTTARMESAMLVGADLSNADLSYAVLQRTDFTGADFYGASYNNANFNRAILTNVSWTWGTPAYLLSERLDSIRALLNQANERLDFYQEALANEYTLSEIADLRPGSTMIEVIDGQATIEMKLEQSDNLTEWADTGETMSVTIPVPDANVKWFRFAGPE